MVILCEFCIKHGEGKKWYQVMKNYSQELLAEDSRRIYLEHFVSNFRAKVNSNVAKLAWAKRKMPLAYRFIRKIATAEQKRSHFGQVVPVEDAEKIVEMVQSVTRIACICRSVTTGNHNARYCLVLGIDPSGVHQGWPELERESLETLTGEDAKRVLREFDRLGLVHSIWTFQTPFIGAICNCDRDCMAYRLQVGSDLINVMFKAEYLAEVDEPSCVGCRNCQKRCQFGAIEYSVANARCYINRNKCYGCGLCRNVCQTGAISLVDKDAIFNLTMD